MPGQNVRCVFSGRVGHIAAAVGSAVGFCGQYHAAGCFVVLAPAARQGNNNSEHRVPRQTAYRSKSPGIKRKTKGTYLPPIHNLPTKLIKVAIRKRPCLPLALVHRQDLPNIMHPDLLPRLHRQLLVPDPHVNSTLERLVERRHAVRRQEQDTLVVLRQAQEHADKRIAVDVVRLSGLQKHICFVEEQDRAPRVGDLHDAVEIVLELLCAGAELAGGHHVQRTTQELCDRLAGESFTHTGRTVEDDVEPFALPYDDVVDRLCGIEAVAADQALEVLLNLRG